MVLAIRIPQVVTNSDLPIKLKEMQRSINPDKTSGLTANCRHLSKLVQAVADYVTKLFCHARDLNTLPPNDAPDPFDFLTNHSAAFAAAAGVTLESLTQPSGRTRRVGPAYSQRGRIIAQHVVCIDALPLSDCSNSPMFHYKSFPDKCASDLAAAFARVVRALLEAITSEDNAHIFAAAG
jgi:hypothetical protein